VVASVTISPREPLRVGDTTTLEAVLLDAKGNRFTGAEVTWRSSNVGVASVHPGSGRVVARSPGTALIIAQSGGESALSEVSVLQLEPAEAPPDVAVDPAPPDEPSTVLGYAPSPPPRRTDPTESQLRAGVAHCYNMLHVKDADRLAALYRPATPSDEENLRKLSRILRTSEWDAAVGARVDGRQRIRDGAAEMEFSFHLGWKDAFGGRLSSDPVFRAEFVRVGNRWEMASCRIVGSPRL
jgi:hypothetical protein